MKLVLYIGHFKTGSSSLQLDLAMNFRQNLRQGILYPAIESRGLMRTSRAMANPLYAWTSRQKALIAREPHNALALRLKQECGGQEVPKYYGAIPDADTLLDTIDSQIRRFEPEAVVLVSEVFSKLVRGRAFEAGERLAKRFEGCDVTIYAVLRRPDEYLSSWHRQRLKFGARLPRFSPGVINTYGETVHIQTAEMIEGWLRLFPDANLILRDYDAVRAAGGAVNAFKAMVPLDFPRLARRSKNSNPSVPAAYWEIARRAIKEGDRRTVVPTLIRAGKALETPRDAEVNMMDVETRQALYNITQPVDRHLGEIVGRGGFFPDIEKVLACPPISDLESARAALPRIREYARKMKADKAFVGRLENMVI